MAATNWDGTANLGGTTNLTATDKMRQKTTPAAMTASGSGGGIGYSAAVLANLVSTLETETDADARRDVLARLVAYYASGQASSVQDRSSVAHALERVRKDADLLVRHLFGMFGPAGIAIDRPTAELLFEFEALVASKRVSAGLPKLPGQSY